MLNVQYSMFSACPKAKVGGLNGKTVDSLIRNALKI
jgi:hypothetical protein